MSKVGFIGGGQMAAALIVGITRSKYCRPQDVLVSDSHEETLKRLQSQVQGIQIFPHDNVSVASQSDVLVLAVKPNIMPKILQEIRGSVKPSQTLVISVAAGVTIASIQSALPAKTRVGNYHSSNIITQYCKILISSVSLLFSSRDAKHSQSGRGRCVRVRVGRLRAAGRRGRCGRHPAQRGQGMASGGAPAGPCVWPVGLRPSLRLHGDRSHG
jgi:pyrroline-5-carboxylate reductase